MGFMETIRRLLGGKSAEQQAEASEKRDQDQKDDDNFRKAMRG